MGVTSVFINTSYQFYIENSLSKFVVVLVFGFYGPLTHFRSYRAQSVILTTPNMGKLPGAGLSILPTLFCHLLTIAPLESVEEEKWT